MESTNETWADFSLYNEGEAGQGYSSLGGTIEGRQNVTIDLNFYNDVYKCFRLGSTLGKEELSSKRTVANSRRIK